MRFEGASGSVFIGFATSCILGGGEGSESDEGEDEDEPLVLELEGFLVEATSRVALESVDLEESEEFFDEIEILGVCKEAAGLGRGSDDFLTETSLSDSLDDELSEDEEIGVIFFLIVVVSVGFAATSGLFFSFLISLAEAIFFGGSTFVFFAGREGLSSDASDSELELEDESELVLRFKLLMRPLTVGFAGLTFAPIASFSSSASLSELELEDDADDFTALVAFLVGFDAILAFLV